MYYMRMNPVDAGFHEMARLVLVRLTNLVTRRYQKYSRYHKVTIKGKMVRKPRVVKPQLVFTAFQQIPSHLRPMSCNDLVTIHGVWYFFACQGFRYQGNIRFIDDRIEVTANNDLDDADLKTSTDLSDPDCIDKVIDFFKRLFPVSDPSCPYRLVNPPPARTRTKRGGTASCSK